MSIVCAVDDYRASGEPIRVVAARHGLSKHALGAALKAAGATRRRGPAHPEATRTAAIADFRGGMSLNAISVKYGVTRWTLRHWLDVPSVGESPEVLDEAGWVRVGLTWRWVA